MSEQVVAKMGLLSPTDAPSVSSVLEEMFEFFDGRVLRRANYRTPAMHSRLRLALMVFGDAGYARLDVAMKP